MTFESSKTIRLSDGGEIRLSFKGDLFVLTRAEKNLLCALSDAVASHELAHPQGLSGTVNSPSPDSKIEGKD